MNQRYAVIGNPIAHSKSPQIHQLFAKQTGKAITYDILEVEDEHFKQAAKQFFENGGSGLNVTMPFKGDAFKFADMLSERAEFTGAVNTLACMPDGRIFGDTTDGTGLVNDLGAQGWNLDNQRILILGAGGAVRGVIDPILGKNPCELVIANRTVEKAETLRNIFDSFGRIRACGFEQLNNEKFDIVINGTSAGLKGKKMILPNSIFAQNAKAYDMTYSAELTPFLQWAKKQGVKNYIDGLGMLVGQAAESFFLWHGIRPKTMPVIDLLRNEL